MPHPCLLHSFLMGARSAHISTRPHLQGLGLTKLGQCMAGNPTALASDAQGLRLESAHPRQSPGNTWFGRGQACPELPTRGRGKTCVSCLGIAFLFFCWLLKKRRKCYPYWYSLSSCNQEGPAPGRSPLWLAEQRGGTKQPSDEACPISRLLVGWDTTFPYRKATLNWVFLYLKPKSCWYRIIVFNKYENPYRQNNNHKSVKKSM